MSRRNKLQKFAELLTFPNVYENYTPPDPELVGLHGEKVDMKGRWASAHFGDARPITLELACGRGEYTLGLARRFPQRNFVGVDVKGARIWKGAKAALDEGLNNVAFLRCRIEMIRHFFAPGEVDDIWITFPDPFLRRSKASRRLTSPHFLDDYKVILKPSGILHLKTDAGSLYDYTLDVLAKYPGGQVLLKEDDIYQAAPVMPEWEIKTYYERQHLAEGKTIKYIRFRLDQGSHKVEAG